MFIRKGPVFVDGVHVFTASRDLNLNDPILPGDIIRPDGSVPKYGDAMTGTEEAVCTCKMEFTQ